MFANGERITSPKNISMNMKRISITVLFIVGFVCTQAGPAYHQAAVSPQAEDMHSQQIMSTGSAYNGTIYAPFDDTAPSQYTEGAMTPAQQPSSGPRRSKITGPDTPPADEFPVGEPWIMALFALLFAIAVPLRRRKA